MSKLNPTRQALAEAIAARTEAEKAVEAAVAAENDALDRRIDARRALDELKQLPQDDPAEAYISALATAHDVSILDLQRPAGARAAQTHKLEQELEFLQELREALKKTTAARRADAERAQFSVSQAALAVIHESDCVARLLDGLAEMQQQVATRRAALHFLKVRDLIPDAQKERVAELLCVDVSGDVRRSNPWALALEALAKDASAKLPEGDD